MSDRSPLLVHRPAMSSLALICAAQFVLQLDFSIVNVALPSMQQQFHVPAANLQWVVTGYALTFGSFLLLGGRAGDVLGRRRLLFLGLVLFALTSLTCGLAFSPLLLILARFLQGVERRWSLLLRYRFSLPPTLRGRHAIELSVSGRRQPLPVHRREWSPAGFSRNILAGVRFSWSTCPLSRFSYALSRLCSPVIRVENVNDSMSWVLD